MINQILKQLENKTIPIKLRDDNTFSGDAEVELRDFSIDFYLEASAVFSKPEPTTLEHYYAGGDLEDCNIDISDIVVFDSSGDQVYITLGEYLKVLELIEKNIEFE